MNLELADQPDSVAPQGSDPGPVAESCGREADCYLHPDVVKYMRQEIAAAGGNEVFFCGRCEQAKVVQVTVLARGNQTMTPALSGQVKAGEVVIHNHPSANLTPSDADLRVASLFGAEDIGFLIIDNPVTRVYAVVEPVEPVVVEPLPLDLVEKYFFADGALAKVLPSFEFRAEQADLARAVVEVFNRKSFLLAEAGTGVGKSLAYLIPAALWAIRHEQRVVISTNTINLQEQLLNKDLPLLTEHLGLPVKAALIKGRSNYLCRRRVKEFAEELKIDANSLDEELKELVAWAQTTGDGSRADFPSLPSAAAWEMVASEADACLSSRCHDFGHCFFYKARREAAKAQLLVVNHHLLMADLQFPSDFGVLPRYEALVMDEVHHLEDAATGYLGENISQIGLLMQLNRLAHQRRPELGLLRRLRRRLGQGSGPPGKSSPKRQNKMQNDFFSTLAAQVESEAEPAVLMLLQDLADHFEAWREILAAAFVPAAEIIDGSFRLRVTDKERGSESWKLSLVDKVENFIEEARVVIKALLLLGHNIEEGLLEKRLPEDFFVAWVGEFKAATGRLQTQVDFIGRFFLNQKSEPGIIAWVEAVAGRRRNFKLVMAPLEVGSLLEEMLYQRLKTLVMVSATIAVERSFDFFMTRVGLGERSCNGTLHSLILTSPFDYRRNALIMVPRDLPLPNEAAYIHALSLFLDTLIARIGGRSLVLFTSYRAMKQAAATCRDSLQRRGVRLLLQGEGQRQWLLNELKNSYNTALFATDSFWEGVDVKGRALECLVIVKLPFKVPTEPVLMARLEYIAACGGNPFYDYSLPQTALKLKQGVGRLIRSRDDRGIIVVCDRRLVEKSYGARLRSVLPDAEFLVLPGGEVIGRAAAFLPSVS
ncbi:MAG: DEAD/DEAH box helicase family protein [Deltaproteobacteria bacterium]|nr:DEAD/DEAH box helicase family protein [Candidatus Tharpella aukensis]